MSELKKCSNCGKPEMALRSDSTEDGKMRVYLCNHCGYCAIDFKN